MDNLVPYPPDFGVEAEFEVEVEASLDVEVEVEFPPEIDLNPELGPVPDEASVGAGSIGIISGGMKTL